jgi:hypothetical protein
MSIERFAAVSGIYGFMNSAYGWPAVETIHYLSIAVLLGTVGLFDLRMLGVAKAISMDALHRFVPLGVCAYVANVLSGAMFFVSAPDQYLYNPGFQLKLLCMLIAGTNVAIFYATVGRSIAGTPAGESAPLPARIMAGVSLASWISVITFGRLITYFRPPYHWCFWCSG